MAEIRWTQEAERWLQEIFDYIAADSPSAAARTVEGIYERAESLQSFPQMGYRYAASERHVRVLLYGHYRRKTIRIVAGTASWRVAKRRAFGLSWICLLGKAMLSRLIPTIGLLALPLIIACGGGGGGTPIRLSEFKFEPGTLTVTAGQPAKVTLQNAGTVVHDFHIHELNVHSPKVQPGQATTFEFTPSRSGTFQIICEEPGHKESGMTGSLTVQ